jgi:hypothetical protein
MEKTVVRGCPSGRGFGRHGALTGPLPGCAP